MSGMFFACTKLKELNLMSFDTKKVENMSEMFSMCRSLQNLYFGYLDLTNTKKIDGIFKNCLNLKLLVVPKEMNAKLKYELDNRYVEPFRFKS
jgi:surface protein